MQLNHFKIILENPWGDLVVAPPSKSGILFSITLNLTLNFEILVFTFIHKVEHVIFYTLSITLKSSLYDKILEFTIVQKKNTQNLKVPVLMAL
jgi:hypothetical protein